MGSEEAVRLGDNVDVVIEALSRDCHGNKKQKKIPKRIHKAEREKQKRDHLNDLFLELSNALDLKQPNNGKASVLCEAARLLKDLFTQIESLRKENTTLLSESHYVTVEKNELREENSTLESQIGKLRGEIEARVCGSKPPDLNTPPPEQAAEAAATGLSQPHAVFILPLGSPDLQHYQLSKPMTGSNVSKPHARYPTSRDSWPPQLLRDPPRTTANDSSEGDSNRA